MLLDYKSLHDGLNQAEINALYSILRKEIIFTETLFMGTTGKYGIYNIVDTGIQVVNAIPTGQYTFNFSDGTVGVGVANDEGIVDVDISFDRSSVCDVVITFPPYVVRINYNLSLSGDKSIIQKNESVVVTALLTMDGSLVSGESLSYSVKHGSTTIDTGTVTTGSDGTASISYVGAGIGDVDIVVSYGTLLQETFVIKDCFAIDNATLLDHNDNIWSNPSWINRGDEYSTITIASGTRIEYMDLDLTQDRTIEFDINSDSANSQLCNFRQDTTIISGLTMQDLGLGANEFHHIKIEINGDSALASNSTNSQTYTMSLTGANRFSLRVYNNTIKFKNFIYY